jgi:predicted peptidase
VITGYSLGGIGTWFFAARHPEWFSAAVPIAGRPGENTDVEVPIYAIHGRNDELIGIKPTRRAINRLRENGAVAELIVVDGPSHYETGAFVRPLEGAVRWIRKQWTQ